MAKRKKKKLLARLKIVEAIPQKEGPGQDKPIFEEFLKMKGVKYKSLSVDNRHRGKKLKNNFLDHLFCPYKLNKKDRFYGYVHISAHGDGESLSVGPNQCVSVTPDDMHEYRRTNSELDLRGSLITLSACGSLLGGFAEGLAKCGANAVIRPLNTVEFQESAMFFILFYFMLSQRGMLKSDDEHNDPEKKTSIRIAEYIDIFQRSKASYLNIGGTGTYRLDYWINQGKKKEHGHLF